MASEHAQSAAPKQGGGVARKPSGAGDTHSSLANGQRPRGFAQTLGDNGQRLAPDLQQSMGSQFGYDFSRVRIHADDRSADLADGIGANAFTVENHIVFGTDKFAPHDVEGHRLLAHELAHVIQQQPNPFDASLPQSLHGYSLGSRSGAAESEARAVAQSLSRGEAVSVRESVTNTVQADLVGAGIGALAGGIIGAAVGAIGGPVGALIGLGIGAIGGAIIGGLVGGGDAATTFPSFGEITADPDVQARMTASWTSTEAAANATSRREEAFWIRLNKATSKFEIGSTILGPSVGPTVGGSANLGAKPADTNSGAANAVYTVAAFHTHTPTTFRPVGRAVGPSDTDRAALTGADVVGPVFDYTDSPLGSSNIPAGHPIGSPAQLYNAGPDRRQRL